MSFKRSIMERLHACSADERALVERVLERLLDGIEVGREQYGALDLRRDDRNWLREGRAELRDWLFYFAAHEIAAEYDEQERRTELRYAEPEPIALPSARTEELALCTCGHPRSLHAREVFGCLVSCTCALYTEVP